jgi:hypothetical protein
MKPQYILLLLATLMAGSVQAAITVSNPNLVVTDHAQTGGDTDFYDSLTNVATGNTPIQTGSNRVSLDVNDVAGQSFTLGSAITLDSIYMAYNDQQSTGTFDLRIDIGNTGTFDHAYTVTLNTTSDLQTGGGNNGPFHFIQFDLSAENISLASGTHSFSLLGVTDNAEGGFLIAPNFANDNYAGGSQITGTTGGTGSLDPARDSFFAVTSVVPEPSTGLLLLLGSAALLILRRRS